MLGNLGSRRVGGLTWAKGGRPVVIATTEGLSCSRHWGCLRRRHLGAWRNVPADAIVRVCVCGGGVVVVMWGGQGLSVRGHVVHRGSQSFEPEIYENPD